MNNLSANEQFALCWLYYQHNGSVLSTMIDGAAIKGPYGVEVPGERTIKSLIKKGLIFITEEEELDGVTFTPSYYLTEEGESLVKTLPW
jgi:hypothetical protein